MCIPDMAHGSHVVGVPTLNIFIDLPNYQRQGLPPPPRPQHEVCNPQSRDDMLTILSIECPSSPIAFLV